MRWENCWRLSLKKSLSVNVGINVVGDRRKHLSRAGESERIANGVVN
jgi:hypothetical protein